MSHHDLIVVGAGAMGAAVAWHAAEESGSDVLVLDRDQPASGTSARGVGIVSRLLWNPLDVGLVNRSVGWFDELSGHAGFHYHAVGGLVIVDERNHADALYGQRLWRAQALDVIELEPDELRDVPGTRTLRLEPTDRAMFIEGDGWGVTTDAVTAMLARARAAGAEVRTGAPVDRALDGAVLLDDGTRLTADAVVVATGAWTPRVLDGTWDVPIAVYRPQAAVLAVDHDDQMPIVHDVPNGTYWRSEGPSKVMAGNGTVLDPQDPVGPPPVEPGFAVHLRESVARRMPSAASASAVRTWAGYEAATPDRRPLAGAVPGTDSLFVLAGGNGFGFMRSPALGESVAAMALGTDPPVPIAEYAPDRFADWDGEPFEVHEGFQLPRPE